MEEKNELEEGEAYSGEGEEDDGGVDSLGYIDDKIQDILGHFQKEFEDAMTMENLGAKVGQYGTFLPAYPRPLNLPQPRSPWKMPTPNTMRHQHVTSEAIQKNPSSVSRKSATSTPAAEYSGKREMLSSTPNNAQSLSQQSSLIKPGNAADQKSLKVRIKVGPDSTLAKSNADIYSGLGLDISPSSSFDDSPDGTGGSAAYLEATTAESPKTIIQIMTGFCIPGGFLLSPLQENLIQLTAKDSKKAKRGLPYTDMPKRHFTAVEPSTFVEEALSTSFSKETNGYKEKGLKFGEKIRKPLEVKTSVEKIDTSTPLSKDIGTETPAWKERIPGSLDTSLLPANKKTETQTDGRKGSTKELGHPKEVRKVLPKNTVALTEGMMSNGDETFDTNTTLPQGKLNLSSMDVKTNNPDDISFYLQREGRCKIDKDLEPVTEPVDNVKQSSNWKASSYEPDRDKLMQGKVESQVQSEPFRDSKDNLSSNSSAADKEQRRSSHGTKSRAEKKPKPPKSRKDTRGDANVEELKDIVSSQDMHSKPKQKYVKSEYEKESSLSHPISKEKYDGKKNGNHLQCGTSVSEPVASPLKEKNHVDPTVVPQNSIVIQENWVCCDKCLKWRLLPYGTDPSHLPKKWLCSMLNWLPGMNRCDFSEADTTDAFHALYQIPAPESAGGLDSNYYVSNTGNNISGTHHIQNADLGNQTTPPVIKKKHKDVSSHSNPSQFQSSTKKIQQVSTKNKSSDDINQYPFESNSVKKVGPANSSKSSDLGREKKKMKQKEKHKNLAYPSSGGDFGGEGEQNLAKNKREVVHDVFRTSKKPKKESSQNGHNDFPSDNDISASGRLPDKLTGNNKPKDSDFSLSKESKYDKKDNLSSSLNNSKDGDRLISNGDIKENFSASDVDKSDNRILSAKKRKMKDWQERQCNQEAFLDPQNADEFITKGISQETDPQGKRAKVLKSERKESRASKADRKLEKRVAKTSLPQSKDCTVDAEDHFVAGEGRQFSQFVENEALKRQIDFSSFKRDISYPQAPAAAHSSSSKVSGSRKCKSNIPESKGSPVESVSSSPLRVPGTEKLSSRRVSVFTNDSTNVAMPTSDTPKRFIDGNVDVAIDRFKKCSKEADSSGQQKYLEDHSNRRSAMQGTLDFEKEIKLLSGGKSEESIDAKRGGGNDSEPADLQEINVATDARTLQDQHGKLLAKNITSHEYNDLEKQSRQQNNSSSQYKKGKGSDFNEWHRGSKGDEDDSKLKVSSLHAKKKDLHSARHDSNCQDEHEFAAGENLDTYRLSTLSNHKDSVSGIAPVPKSSRPTAQEKVQAVPPNPRDSEVRHYRSDKHDRAEMSSRTGRSNLNMSSDDKKETLARVHNSVSSTPKGSRSEVYDADAINADAPKVVKPSRHPAQNGSHHNVARHAIANGSDVASPSKKDAVAVYRLMKEARGLKHSANRMKSEGQEHESTGVYFEAALKFLHAAFLMEADSLKQGEATQLYHDTAKLCDFVAHEYEKLKEMTAAALAYKCVEVAFLKAAFHKNPHASKDRNELLAALQMLPPGESPSSSASDVDSLNNQATLGKVTSVKGVASSPQITGNHVIAPRHHTQVMKLLQYTNDLNCAFEATRKSQTAYAAASASLGKDQLDALSSVSTVLNFNFHNVEELLRLVRLAQQSIGR